ncbi:hypothetical protein BLOT_005600 [Blomia tropicalis]|nr:hypothetical protein BLOT_005600 [Blomia tropicalis]
MMNYFPPPSSTKWDSLLVVWSPVGGQANIAGGGDELRHALKRLSGRRVFDHQTMKEKTITEFDNQS